MKPTHKAYGDTARRTGSDKMDTLSKVAFVTGLIALVAFILYLGVIADTLISLVEMV